MTTVPGATTSMRTAASTGCWGHPAVLTTTTGGIVGVDRALDLKRVVDPLLAPGTSPVVERLGRGIVARRLPAERPRAVGPAALETSCDERVPEPLAPG